MKNKKSKYITILRYIFRGTLASSIYLALRTAFAYDPITMSFWLTGLKVLTLGAFILISAKALSQIDAYFSRRIERLNAFEVAEMAARQGKPCINCAYRKENFCGKRCEESVEEWLNERT